MATLNKSLISRILESCFRFPKVKVALAVNQVSYSVQSDQRLGIVGYGREKRCMLKILQCGQQQTRWLKDAQGDNDV